MHDVTERVRGDVLHVAPHGKGHRSDTNSRHVTFLGRLHIFPPIPVAVSYT